MKRLYSEVCITTYLTTVYGIKNQTNFFKFTLNAPCVLSLQ